MSVPVFDPNRYPRTYRPWIVLRIAVGLLCALIVAAFTNTLLEQVRQGTLVGMSSCLLDLAVIALAAVAAMSLLRARVVMTPTSLELRSLWTTRRVSRRDILDHELLPLRSGTGFRVNASTLARTMVSAMPIGPLGHCARRSCSDVPSSSWRSGRASIRTRARRCLC